MFKYRDLVFVVTLFVFLGYSFYPTLFEISKANKLTDPRREFILEHNFYWPDYNLYLSKIRQGWEGRATAVEKYTSEPHSGSLLQIFYVYLGALGKILGLTPDYSYLLGRIILSPILLIITLSLCFFYFKSFLWRLIAFLIVIVSGSFPQFIQTPEGIWKITRYMEWWSNIDALQRITFIPHILFGQIVSFFLLYQLISPRSPRLPIYIPVVAQFAKNFEQMERTNGYTVRNLIAFRYIILGNLAGLAFPPSLITLNGVLLLLILIKIFKNRFQDAKYKIPARNASHSSAGGLNTRYLLFILFSLPSLLYIYIVTRFLPWSALVQFHRTHPMMIPFDQYVLGTGPVFFLGFLGALVSIVRRDTRLRSMILWIIVTISFASFFSIIKDQSPLRFTQTGLFIPLGILTTYLFYQLYHLPQVPQGVPLQSCKGTPCKTAVFLFISLYLLGSLFIMNNSLTWQTTFITQRVGADIPPVPWPPQTMYPLREWMDGIRWLRDNTNHDEVVLAEITAGNHIPAYSGNTVYFGQSNTVDYERKASEVERFFKGDMSPTEAELFLKNGRIKYVFFSLQEKERSEGKDVKEFYPFLTDVYANPIVSIYKS